MVAAAPRRIGTYLNRPVCCTAIDHAVDFGVLDVEGMLVLLHTGNSRLLAEEKKELANQIVQRRPLNTFFTGTDAEAMFDLMIRALDVPAAPLPMMTNFSAAGLVEAVDEFLSATWPPEERWEEWQGYLLVNIGGPIAVVEIAATDLCTGIRPDRNPPEESAREEIPARAAEAGES